MAERRKLQKRQPTIAPVHPNAGLEVQFRGELERLVDDMQRSIVYWVKAAYRAKTPEIAKLAQDSESRYYGMSPARALIATMRRLGRQWTRRFDDLAAEMAEHFTTQVSRRSDAALMANLRKAGFAVEFQPSRAVNDALQAAIGEQVSLIKSIAQEHLTQVEGIVMRSVQAGRDLEYLTEELQKRYGITRRRAANIARDQNNKATATITRVRQLEIGITQARWLHSAGGRHPRPTHVQAGRDRVVYDVSEGWYDPAVKRRIWPGTEINCRCVSRPIVPGIPARKEK